MNDQKRPRAFFLLAFFAPIFALAQTDFSDSLGLAVAPGLTPVVEDGRTEAAFFAAFSTFLTEDTASFRGSQALHVLQMQRGMSPRNRFSAGFDLVFTDFRVGPSGSVAPFFGGYGYRPDDGLAAHALTAVGLRARFVPMIRRPEFWLQATLFFPTAPAADRVLTGEDRTRISIQGNWATLFAPGWHVVAQLGPQVRLKNDDRRQTSLETPATAYVVRRIWRGAGGRRLFAFGGAGFFSAFEKRFKGGLRQTSWSSSVVLGAQFADQKGSSLSVSWQLLPFFDPSLRLKKGSFQSVSIGGRRVF